MVRNTSTPLLSPNLEETLMLGGRYKVVIFDNEHTSMDEVVRILIEATHCDVQEDYIEMWEAHHFGQSAVHFASETTCLAVADVIGTVGVKAEVAKEWDD